MSDEKKPLQLLAKEYDQEDQKLRKALDGLSDQVIDLEKTKALLREAIMKGDYRKIDEKRAKELAYYYERGIQLFPLYPEDWEQKDRTETTTKRTEWIYVKPPPIFPLNQSKEKKYIYTPFGWVRVMEN